MYGNSMLLNCMPLTKASPFLQLCSTARGFTSGVLPKDALQPVILPMMYRAFRHFHFLMIVVALETRQRCFFFDVWLVCFNFLIERSLCKVKYSYPPRAILSTRITRMMVGFIGSSEFISSRAIPTIESRIISRSSWFHL